MNHLDERVARLYRDAMAVLDAARVPFLVGGAYAFARYTGVVRHSKDFDLFLRQTDVAPALAALADAGWETEIPFPHWLGKAHRDGEWVDLIYSSGNGIGIVDDAWFQHAVPADVLGVPVRLIPAEEMIWSKGYIMERERFDGADIAHVLLARADHMDWSRLVARFGSRWRVLMSHLILFGFIYPGQRHRIPADVMREMLGRAAAELDHGDADADLCCGTLLSREQYLADLDAGYRDVRLGDDVAISEREIGIWNNGIAVDGEAATREAKAS